LDCLTANCIPEEIIDRDVEQFDNYLKRRQALTAAKVAARIVSLLERHA